MGRWRKLVGAVAHALLDGLADDLAASAGRVVVRALHVGRRWLGFEVVAALAQSGHVCVSLRNVDVDLLLHVDVVDLFGAGMKALP